MCRERQRVFMPFRLECGKSLQESKQEMQMCQPEYPGWGHDGQAAMWNCDAISKHYIVICRKTLQHLDQGLHNINLCFWQTIWNHLSIVTKYRKIGLFNSLQSLLYPPSKLCQDIMCFLINLLLSLMTVTDSKSAFNGHGMFQILIT